MRLSKPLCCLAFMAALTTPAYAYLDPGTGSIILQGLLAAVAAGAASASLFWHRVKAFFIREKQGKDSAKHK